MIVLTRLNGKSFSLNADLIERIEANPDTTVSLIDGSRYIVTEPMSYVIELVEDYKARVLARSRSASERRHRPPLEALAYTDTPDRQETQRDGAAVTPFPPRTK